MGAITNEEPIEEVPNDSWKTTVAIVLVIMVIVTQWYRSSLQDDKILSLTKQVTISKEINSKLEVSLEKSNELELFIATAKGNAAMALDRIHVMQAEILELQDTYEYSLLMASCWAEQFNRKTSEEEYSQEFCENIENLDIFRTAK